MTWLDTITGPLGTVTKSLQELMEVRDLVKFGDTFRKMHADVLAAQSSALAGYTRELALLDRVREAEKEVADLKATDTRKQRYELKALGASALAYMLKPDTRGTEPPHWVCTKCYEYGLMMILQYRGTVAGRTGFHWQCPGCQTMILPRESTPKWLDDAVS